MGGFQGFLGWFMVKSGLIDNPDVSHYRLALHLTFAFITFAYTFWVALDLYYPNVKLPIIPLRNIARIVLIVLIIQIIYGGFVAGLNAGLVHNHWPLMADGQFFHESILIEKPSLVYNFIEGKSGVQFIHRTFAYFVVASILFLWWKSKKIQLNKNIINAINLMVFIVLTQFLLGVFTILYFVPLWLGLAHQVTAFILLSVVVYTLHRLSK
jgi:cytochrome c oxidase assembly protein subunit 15